MDAMTQLLAITVPLTPDIAAIQLRGSCAAFRVELRPGRRADGGGGGLLTIDSRTNGAWVTVAASG